MVHWCIFLVVFWLTEVWVLGGQKSTTPTNWVRARVKFVTNAVETWVLGAQKYNKNKQLDLHAGQICDECGGDGPTQRGFWGKSHAPKTSNLVGTRCKFVTNVVETDFPKCGFRGGRIQQKRAIGFARGANS